MAAKGISERSRLYFTKAKFHGSDLHMKLEKSPTNNENSIVNLSSLSLFRGLTIKYKCETKAIVLWNSHFYTYYYSKEIKTHVIYIPFLVFDLMW